MPTVELRPNGTAFNGGWTLTGAASVHAALADASDSSYVTAPAGYAFLNLDLDAFTAAHTRITAVSLRIKRLGNGADVFHCAIGYKPPGDDYASHVFTDSEKPAAGAAEKTYGSLSAAPDGKTWDNNIIIPRLQVGLGGIGTGVRVHAVWVVVHYATVPSMVFTAPVGTVTGTQSPTAEWVYSGDTAQERFQLKVFTAAQYSAAGFSPDTSTAFWDSGAVLSSAPSGDIGTLLPEGDYRVYGRVAAVDALGSYGPWVYSDFTMGGELPATPSVTVTAESSLRRVKIVATQNDNLLPYATANMAAEGGEGDGWHADTNTVLASVGSTSATTTTLTEAFGGALSSWTTLTGALSTTGGQLTSSTSGSLASMRHNTSLPSDDHYAQIKVVTLDASNDRSCHVGLRFSTSANTGYICEINQKNNRFAVWKITAGVGTAISGFKPLKKTLVLPAVWRGEIEGDRIRVYLDGVLQGEFTDSTITTGPRVVCGMYNANSVSRADDFEAGDLDPVVQGSSGSWLLEMTATAARQARARSGGRMAWGCPVTPGETLTVTGKAWQTSNAARSCRIDVEYAKSDGTPLSLAVADEQWTGSDGAAWGGNWTSSHGSGASSDIQSNQGRLRTGTSASSTPARQYFSGMSSMADCEVLVKYVPGTVASESYAVVGVRGNGSWSAEATRQHHPVQGYFVEVAPLAGEVRVREGGSGSPILATITKTCPTNGLWIRLRVHGTTIAAKAWDNFTTPEPTMWDWIGEDTTWTSGKVSLTGNNGADAVQRTHTFDELYVDDLSKCNFGSPFSTLTTGALVEHTRNVTVPSGAVDASVILVAFPTGAGEKFVWDEVGLLPGSSRPWSRGGLMVRNMLGPNESTFEVSAAGVAGWVADGDGLFTRDTPVGPVSRAAGKLTWAGSSGIPSYVTAASPGKAAAEGLDYVVRAMVFRSTVDTLLLRVGLRFTAPSGATLAESFGVDVLPSPSIVWGEAVHTAVAPPGTARVHGVLATTPLVSGYGAITRVMLVQDTTAPTVFQVGPAAVTYALAEYSDDGGVTWTAVRGTEDAVYDLTTRQVTLYDYESPPGAERDYRVSTAALDYGTDPADGAMVASEPSASQGATVAADGFWLSDPLTPGSSLRVQVGGNLESSSPEPQETHYPLGRRTPVVVSDVVKAEIFSVPLIFKTAADWTAFEALRTTGRTLLFQSDMGLQWYVRLGPDRRVTLHSSTGRLTAPLRKVEILMTEVDRPS